MTNFFTGKSARDGPFMEIKSKELKTNTKTTILIFWSRLPFLLQFSIVQSWSQVQSFFVRIHFKLVAIVSHGFDKDAQDAI